MQVIFQNLFQTILT